MVIKKKFNGLKKLFFNKKNMMNLIINCTDWQIRIFKKKKMVYKTVLKYLFFISKSVQ
jgi:hypothetical protein